MKLLVLKKSSIIAIFFTILIIGIGSLWAYKTQHSYPTVSLGEAPETIELVTGEFKTKTADGKEIESYRWDPGTIVVEKDKKVQLVIHGVNGDAHPFHIEGTNIKGTVKKGKATVVNVTFTKEGTYRLICETHATMENNGPMIAYIVVD
ncbi:cupredoxin domain-containing protein [Rossellomorea aquimaris]|uniref:cupredoxin domain-containing protein n=1 Tax=Rossellomorea aquimaris TaxID=189382 RepID=UPI001CD45E52|nr:cupredoxin domain-containing protein [Rossellomorea aquimaris]MCA1053948.1 cupredoxin domain-containing protein [Rossellomorea aquimaris]